MLEQTSPRYLLILGCSSRKRHDLQLLPAIERYDGVNYRVLRRAMRTSCEMCMPSTSVTGDRIDRLDILILSAELGLIEPDMPIPDYDRRMTPARASELRPAASTALDAKLADNSYAGVFVNLGKTYRSAIEDSRLLHAQAHVVSVSGGIGQQMAQMKQWLLSLH